MWYRTQNCIICGRKAREWHGHVTKTEKRFSGKTVKRKVIAGFCALHTDTSESKDGKGWYGNYNETLMGEVIPM